jgi:prepilin peptidase CpaA
VGFFDSVGKHFRGQSLKDVMISLFLYTFGLLITLGAAALAAWTDLRSFRIPNMATVLALLGFALAYIGVLLVPGDSLPLMHDIRSHLASAGVMFVLTLALFLARSIGAGDAKFASALALWPGLMGLTIFVFYMSLIGGAMGVATILLRKFKPFPAVATGNWIHAAQNGENRIPYGLAIALGFVMSIVMLGLYDITAITNAVENGE